MPETITCVYCKAPLRLPEQFIGQEVRCPSCQKTFTARLPAAPPPRPESHEEPPEDDAPPSRVRPRHEEDEDYPRPRRPRYEEDDEDYPRSRSGRGDRSGMVLTFGIIGLVLAFLSLCCLPFGIAGFGLGLTATILGRTDLNAIRRGARDPNGEGMTRGGFICGLIGTILAGLFLLVHCGFAVFSIVNGK
jgi:hypothetical protein